MRRDFYAYHVNHLLKQIASGLTISRLLAELWRACAMRLPFARGQPQRFIAKVLMRQFEKSRLRRSPRACPDRNSQFDSRHAPAANQIDHVTLRPGAAALAMATNTLRVFLRSPKQARLAAGWAARASRRCHAKAEVRV